MRWKGKWQKKDIRIAPDVFFIGENSFYLLILAHESLSVTVRLKTRCSGSSRCRAEIAHALELHGLSDGNLAQRGFQIARDLDHRLGVEVVLPRLSLLHVVGVRLGEERVEQPDFGFHGVLGRHPVDDALHAAAVARRTPADIGS